MKRYLTLAFTLAMLTFIGRGQPLPPQAMSGLKWTSLTGLTPVEKQVGWGNFLTGKLLLDGRPVEVRRKTILNGIFAHAPSTITYDIGDMGYTAFRGSAGLRDGVFGEVQFIIQGDGRELWKSPVIRKEKPNAHPPEASFAVDIAGVSKLTLIVDMVGNGSSDHSVWISPDLGKK